MAILTKNSLSITPKIDLPVDAAAGMWASQDDGEDRVKFIADGESLPTATERTWGGSVTTVQDFG